MGVSSNPHATNFSSTSPPEATI